MSHVPSPGTRAPDFELTSIEGGRVRLADFRGRKVLIAFLRNAECALCNLWVHEASSRAAAWRARGLEVIAVFEATTASLRAHRGDAPAPFAIVADPDGQVHERYGSRNDAAAVERVASSPEAGLALARARAAGFEVRRVPGTNFARLPSEIIVGEDGRVLDGHVAEHVTDHMPRERIESWLRPIDGSAIFAPDSA